MSTVRFPKTFAKQLARALDAQERIRRAGVDVAKYAKTGDVDDKGDRGGLIILDQEKWIVAVAELVAAVEDFQVVNDLSKQPLENDDAA